MLSLGVSTLLGLLLGMGLPFLAALTVQLGLKVLSQAAGTRAGASGPPHADDLGSYSSASGSRVYVRGAEIVGCESEVPIMAGIGPSATATMASAGASGFAGSCGHTTTCTGRDHH